MFLFQNSEISLFETNIRFMGSLLACYALTGDVMFRDKAAQLGERMLPAFQTETGIPHSLINLHTGVSRTYPSFSSGFLQLKDKLCRLAARVDISRTVYLFPPRMSTIA